MLFLDTLRCAGTLSLALALASSALAGTHTRDVYDVSAHYSGVVNKSFPGLGQTRVEMDYGPSGRAGSGRETLAVSVKGSMRHPTEDRQLDLTVNGKYMLDKNIYLTAGNLQMPDDFASCQKSLQNLMPFLYVARREVGRDGAGSQQFLVSGGGGQESVVLKVVKTGASSWNAVLENAGKVQATLELDGTEDLAGIRRIELPVPDKKIRLVLVRRGGAPSHGSAD